MEPGPLSQARAYILDHNLETLGMFYLLEAHKDLEKMDAKIEAASSSMRDDLDDAIAQLSGIILPFICENQGPQKLDDLIRIYGNLLNLYQIKLPEDLFNEEDVEAEKLRYDPRIILAHDPDLIVEAVKTQKNVAQEKIDFPKSGNLSSVTLCEDIRLLTKKPCSFFEVVQSLKHINDPSLTPLMRKLKFPEQLCDLSNPLEELAEAQLTNQSPLFKNLHAVITAINNVKPSSKEVEVSLNQLKEIYQNFIRKVCETKDEKRLRVIQGKARLFIGPKCYLVEQKRARKIISVNKYGSIKCQNAYGAAAVTRIDSVYFKRPRNLNPLLPGEEFLAHTLYELVGVDQGISMTKLLKVDNIWVQKVTYTELDEGHPAYKELTARLAEYQTQSRKGNNPNLLASKVFKEFPALSKNYPFKRESLKHLVLASSEVKGINLRDHILQGLPLKFHPDNFSSLCFLALLLLSTDARSDNFITSKTPDNSYWITGVDNDLILTAAYRMSEGNHLLDFHCSLLLFPQMADLVGDHFIENLLQKTPEDIFLYLLSALTKREIEDEKLLSDGIFTKNDYENVYLPTKFSLPALLSLYHRLKKLWNLLKKAKEESLKITNWEMVDAISPNISEIYQSLLRKHKNDILEAEMQLFNLRNPIILEKWVKNIDQEATESLSWEYQPHRLLQSISHCTESISLSSLTKVEQARWIERCLLFFPMLDTLTLKECSLSDKELFLTLSSVRGKKLSFVGCSHITENLLFRLFQECTDTILISDCPSLSMEGMLSLSRYAIANNCSLVMVVNHQKLSIEKDKVQEHFLTCLKLEATEFAELFLDLGAACKNENYPLHDICEVSCPKGIEFLLQKGIDSSLQNSSGLLPLHIAARHGHLKNVETLLTIQQEVDIPDKEGYTPIFHAAFSGNRAIINLLRDRSNLSLRVQDKTILDLAVSEGHLELLKDLLDIPTCQDLVHQSDQEEETLLHKAVSGSSKPEMVEFLSHYDSTLYRKNKMGNYPIHAAAKNGQSKSFRLLASLPNSLKQVDREGITPLELALKNNQEQIFLALLFGDTPPKAPNRYFISYYSKCLSKAQKKENRLAQIFYMIKFCDLFLEQGNFLTAANWIHSALELLEEESNVCKKILYGKLEAIEIKFLASKGIQGKSFPVSLSKQRVELKSIRQETKEAWQSHEPLQTVLARFTEKVEAVLLNIIQESISTLEKPPCDYTIISVGEFAKKELLPYSKPELAILVGKENDNHKIYFRKLSELIELRMLYAGIGPVLRGKNLLNSHHLFLQKTTPMLIGTPKELAALHYENQHEKHVLKGCSLFVNGGKKNLYTDYLSKCISENQKELALKSLEEDLEYSPDLLSKEGICTLLDIKKDLYLPLKLILEDLFLYYGTTEGTTAEKIDQLASKKVLTAEGAESIKQAFFHFLNLRMEAHFFYESGEEIIKHAQKEKCLRINAEKLKYYPVLCTLYKAAKDFIKEGEGSYLPFYWSFKIDDLVMRGLILERAFEYEEALKVFNEELNKEPIETLESDQVNIPLISHIGHLENHLLHFNRALQLHETALHIGLKFGKYHATVASSYNNLGLTYYNLGNHSESLLHFSSALETFKMIYKNKAHPSIPFCLKNIGKALFELGRYPEAFQNYQEALKLYKQYYLDKPHIEIAQTLHGKGETLHEAGLLKQALKSKEEALSIYEDLANGNPLSTASCLNDIGISLDALGKHKEAGERYDAALMIFKNIYPGAHPDIANCLSNKGMALHNRKRFEKALKYKQMALKIYRKIYKGPSLLIASCHHSIALTLESLHRTQEALKNYTKALEISQKIEGEQAMSFIERCMQDMEELKESGFTDI